MACSNPASATYGFSQLLHLANIFTLIMEWKLNLIMEKFEISWKYTDSNATSRLQCTSFWKLISANKSIKCPYSFKSYVYVMRFFKMRLSYKTKIICSSIFPSWFYYTHTYHLVVLKIHACRNGKFINDA